jgi:hypothetical protein
MKMSTMTAIAIALLAATPALAKGERTQRGMNANSNGTASYARGQVTTEPQPGVYVGGEYRGWDPDPFIRLQLMREDPNSQGE